MVKMIVESHRSNGYWSAGRHWPHGKHEVEVTEEEAEALENDHKTFIHAKRVVAEPPAPAPEPEKKHEKQPERASAPAPAPAEPHSEESSAGESTSHGEHRPSTSSTRKHRG